MKDILLGLWGLVTDALDSLSALADRVKAAQPIPVPVRTGNDRRPRK